MNEYARSLVPRSVVRTGALARAGGAADFASHEFFGARIRNPHTRRAYGRAVGRFLAWVEAEGLDLARVTPGMAGQFLDTLPGGPPAKQQALSACRMGSGRPSGTGAAERTSTPREVAEAALAHTVQNPTEAAYARSDLFERRRRLMDHWASAIDKR